MNYEIEYHDYENKRFNRSIIDIIASCGPPSLFCCLACFCSWLPTAQIVARLEDPRSHTGRMRRFQAWNNTLGFFIFLFIFTLVIPPVQLLLEICIIVYVLMAFARVSVLYGIVPNPCMNCLKSFFCTCCSIIQIGDQIWDRLPQECGNLEAAVHIGSSVPLDIV